MTIWLHTTAHPEVVAFVRRAERKRTNRGKREKKLTDESQRESVPELRGRIAEEVDEAVQHHRPDEEIRVVDELEESGAEEVRPERPGQGVDQRGRAAPLGPAVGPVVRPAGGTRRRAARVLPSFPSELLRPLLEEPSVRRVRRAVGRQRVAGQVRHVQAARLVARREERPDPAEGQRGPRPGREAPRPGREADGRVGELGVAGRVRLGRRRRAAKEGRTGGRVAAVFIAGGRGRPGRLVGDPDGAVVGPAAHSSSGNDVRWQ